MTRLAVGDPAPDFILTDTNGRPSNLASYRGRRSVVLVFNRGFS